MNKLYYTAPTNEVFDEVKKASIELWKTYDDTHGYASDKIGKISDIKNVSDNLMYMVAMFDSKNQVRLSRMISLEASDAIGTRMIDGGANRNSIPFSTID